MTVPGTYVISDGAAGQAILAQPDAGVHQHSALADGDLVDWGARWTLLDYAIQKPTSPHATNVPGVGISVSWTAVDDAVGYNVYTSLTQGGPYTKLTTPNPDTASPYSHAAPTVAPHYYVVTAVSDNGEESARSAEVSATYSLT